MTKRGELCEAYRIVMIDNVSPIPILQGLLEHDGWVVFFPDKRMSLFVNRKSKKMFYDLGEL